MTHQVKNKYDVTIRRFNACYCARGVVQNRLPPEPLETYYPVLQWDTVRMLLIFQSIIVFQRQVLDFTNDFAQVDIPRGKQLFIELPRYLNSDGEQCGVVLILEKIQYGQAKAAHLWYKILQNGLLYRGFLDIKVNPCL